MLVCYFQSKIETCMCEKCTFRLLQLSNISRFYGQIRINFGLLAADSDQIYILFHVGTQETNVQQYISSVRTDVLSWDEYIVVESIHVTLWNIYCESASQMTECHQICPWDWRWDITITNRSYPLGRPYLTLKYLVYYSVTLPNWRPTTTGLCHTFIHTHTSYNQFVFI